MASGEVIAHIVGLSTPTTNFATPNYTGGRIPMWEFDDATDETMYWIMYMGKNYNTSADIDVTVPWKFATSGSSQTCDWEIAIARMQDATDDIETLTFATAQTGLFTESGSNQLDYDDITFTNAQFDSVGNNTFFCLRVVRDASGGTASPGDAQFLAPIVRQA